MLGFAPLASLPLGALTATATNQLSAAQTLAALTQIGTIYGDGSISGAQVLAALTQSAAMQSPVPALDYIRFNTQVGRG